MISTFGGEEILTTDGLERARHDTFVRDTAASGRIAEYTVLAGSFLFRGTGHAAV